MNTEEAIEKVKDKYEGWMGYARAQKEFNELEKERNEVIALLQRGEKYEAMVKDIEEAMTPGKIIEYEGCLSVSTIVNSLEKIIKDIKQKHFSEPIKKIITIEIEAKNENQFNDRISGLKKYLQFCNDHETGDEDYNMKIII